MSLFAEIKGIKYTPCLCRELRSYKIGELGNAINRDSSFLLEINKSNKIALSWWVSAKRTRSYPYARVYDTLDFSGKKITIIPIFKDEGKDGDRDFLQWDTISLMSLLGVYVIIGYYIGAEKSKRYTHKITHQKFDIDFIKEKIKDILNYKSDALHWNLEQIENIADIGGIAIKHYSAISKRTSVEMHSVNSAKKRITNLRKSREEFMNLSRELAEKAQKREEHTIQPKENISGTKGSITIKNYLGGLYYFTVDEIEILGKDIHLIEAKHSRGQLPSLEDIKDGLIKMILFTNLETVIVNNKNYNPIAILKLTVENNFDRKNLSEGQSNTLELLKKEAQTNGFEIRLS